MKIEFAELIKLVYQWGIDRKIITNGNIPAQVKKLKEEIQEIEDGVNKRDKKEIYDGVGDTFVVMIMIAGIAKKDIREIITDNLAQSTGVDGNLFSYDEDKITDYFAAITRDLSQVAAGWGSTLEDCLYIAYDEIKDRTGHLTKEGIFVKDE